MFTKVLVPLDGSDLAEGILPYVTQMARGLNCPIVLLSVVDPDAIELPDRLRARVRESHFESVQGAGTFEITVTGPRSEAPGKETGSHPHESGGPYASQMFDRVESEVKRLLEGVAERLRRERVTVQSAVYFGRPAEEIVRVAEREGCDFIAMSTHGRGAWGRGILGSVTDKVIHSSRVPTLTITPQKAEKYWRNGVTISRIMLPLDGSALAETALPYVEELARKLSLGIVLVRALRTDGFYSASAGGYPYTGRGGLDTEAETDAINYLKGIAERLRAQGLEARWRLLRGAPARSIVELAQETPQDIIALTTHGRSGFSRWLLGSVAEAVVRASGDPVLVIPPARDE